MFSFRHDYYRERGDPGHAAHAGNKYENDNRSNRAAVTLIYRLGLHYYVRVKLQVVGMEVTSCDRTAV